MQRINNAVFKHTIKQQQQQLFNTLINNQQCSYAKMMRGMKAGGMRHRVYNLSGVAHPYVPAIYKQNMNSLFSLEGLKERKNVLVNWWKKWASLLLAWRKFGKKEFYPWNFASQTALNLYKDLNVALHKQDFSALKKFTTSEAQGNFKNAIRDHEYKEGIWALKQLNSARVVHATSVDGKQLKVFIVQVTVHFSGVETITLNDGTIVQETPQDRYIVFEKNAFDVYGGWKIAAEISPEDVSNKVVPMTKMV